ncbi:MAG: Gfo/Idh/MocA family oxidoreductase [Opitutus sp.]
MPRLPFRFLLVLTVAITTSLRVHAATELRVGIIGLDTSHVVAFTKLLNDPSSPDHIAGARIVAAFRSGSEDMPEKSFNRVAPYAAELSTKYGVTLCATVEELVAQVDAIMIENVDGRKHLEIARAVFPSGKPVFIDKPYAGTLAQGIEIMRLARAHQVPCFSASSLRFVAPVQQLTLAQKKDLRTVMTFSPAEFEPHHPDLFWYGIHGIEMLYQIVGPGCQSVSRTHAPNGDVVTGLWADGRLGIFFGYREAKADYGYKIIGEKGATNADFKADYIQLVREIVTFFQTKRAPVSLEESVEVLAFMEAADESKRRGGALVTITETMHAAEASMARAAQ